MTAKTEDNLKEYTRSQVEQHCTHDDLWLLFRDKVLFAVLKIQNIEV